MMEKLSKFISNAIGTPASIAIHTIWFAAWVGLSMFDGFDPGLTILTGVLTIYGIYLLIFLLVDEKADARRTQKDVKADQSTGEDILKTVKAILKEVK